jgi:hypothetical protein
LLLVANLLDRDGEPNPESSAATMNAENVPNVRQSRRVLGLKKLKANAMKTAELMRTNVQSP